MLSVEIKINETTLKKYIAVRKDTFRSPGATHEYEVEMIVEEDLDDFRRRLDRYPVGRLEHRYCAGAVSLAEKMLKFARQKGMHK
jgi:hypothetical protein